MNAQLGHKKVSTFAAEIQHYRLCTAAKIWKGFTFSTRSRHCLMVCQYRISVSGIRMSNGLHESQKNLS